MAAPLTDNLPVYVGSNFAASNSWFRLNWATVRPREIAPERSEWQQERA
jgi:hypothetical protein